MSLTLQILLIIFTVLFFIILVKNVKKGKLRTDYALAWILCSIALIILSVFPQIAFFVARLIGVISTANIVFAAIIFMLIILVYVLFNKVSMLEEKQKNLIQEIAILKKKNDVVVFVRNLMDNVLYQEAYDALSEKVDKTLRVVSRIRDELKKDADKAKDQSAQLLDIANCDAFRGLDSILIDWALDQLNDEILDAQIDGMNLAQIAEQRTTKACHFGNVYKNEYQAIKYAYQMMKAVSVMEVTSDIKEMVADYQKQTYLIDSYYRWFYSAYDCMEDTERFAQVRERIENMYSFTYLQKVTPKWNQELTENLMADTGLKRQEDFYRNYLNAYEGKNRVIVIISDAFRYECAKGLMERLELDEKCTPKLECMISGLPSVTSVGMASLLPHKELHVNEKLNVTVDGQSCGDLASRDKILKVQNENNVVLSFDEVASANKEKIRELLQKKNIVYIYR